MFSLIIDPAAGRATKPRGADISAIDVFSLATAPRVCIKIVLHLIWMQVSACISITKVSESVPLIPQTLAVVERPPRRRGRSCFSQQGRSSVRITLPLHHILHQSRIAGRARRWSLNEQADWPPKGRVSGCPGLAGACPRTRCHVINSCSLVWVRP